MRHILFQVTLLGHGIYNLEWVADDNIRNLEMEKHDPRDALRFPALRTASRPITIRATPPQKL